MIAQAGGYRGWLRCGCLGCSFPLLVLAALVVLVIMLAGCCHPGPRACTRPALPSGDQMLRHGVIWTCSDGVWHTR